MPAFAGVVREQQLVRVARLTVRQRHRRRGPPTSPASGSRISSAHPSASAPESVTIRRACRRGSRGTRDRTNRASARMSRSGLDARLSVPRHTDHPAGQELAERVRRVPERRVRPRAVDDGVKPGDVLHSLSAGNSRGRTGTFRRVVSVSHSPECADPAWSQLTQAFQELDERTGSRGQKFHLARDSARWLMNCLHSRLRRTVSSALYGHAGCTPSGDAVARMA